jgi:hypothetical protein
MHRKKRNRTPLVSFLLSLASAGFFAAGVWQGLDYTPDYNPGATGNMVRLFVVAAVLAAIVSFLAIRGIVRSARREMTRTGMSPLQQAVTETTFL